MKTHTDYLTFNTKKRQEIIDITDAVEQCRAAAGIEIETRSYPQSALTLSFAHSRPHRDTSTEFHTPSGPFTLVPLPGNRSSLVWVLDPAEAETISAFTDDELSAELGEKLTIAKLNIDENPHVPTKYGVRGIPTMMIFQNGQVAATKVGALPKSKIKEWIESSI